MYRPALRSAWRSAAPLRMATSRRFVSSSGSAPADRPRSWKSAALRWGLAGAAVYYYNTSTVFAEEAASAHPGPAPPAFAEDELPTVDAVLEEKRRQIQTRLEKPVKSTDKATEKPADKSSDKTTDKPAEQPQNATVADGSPAALEEEAGQQGAFNPETGEINWDCPCLGGMADGPCGEEFKTAFSCFVYSTEEPKGMDCIEKFQGMQECFKKYPDIYGSELADEEAEAEAEAAAANPDNVGEPPEAAYQKPRDEPPVLSVRDNTPETHNLPGVQRIKPTEDAPKQWEDATAANKVVDEKKQ